VRFAWGTGRSQQYTVADKTHSDHVPGTAVAAVAAAAAAAAAVIVVVVVAADMAVVVVVVNLFSISKKKTGYIPQIYEPPFSSCRF
jgi:Flp pilus assembly protein TadB